MPRSRGPRHTASDATGPVAVSFRSGAHVKRHSVRKPPQPRSGTICEHSMPDPFAVPSTSSSPDIAASPSAPPEGAVVPMIPANSGPMSSASWGSASPNGSSAKMSPAKSPSVLKPSGENFGAWVTHRQTRGGSVDHLAVSSARWQATR